jgi:hypothetical protein
MKVKTNIIGLLLTLLILFTGHDIFAQERGNEEPRVSPNATVSQTIGTTVVTVTYGRPSVRDREIFGGLEPYGVVWRAGANEATTFTFSDDVLIEGEELESGTYSFFVLPRENDEWTIIFNSVANQWGSYNYEDSEDVLRVEVSPVNDVPMEQLMYYFEDVSENSAEAVMHWSTVKVPFTIEAS